MLQNVKMTEHIAEKSKMTKTIAKKTQILPNQLLDTFYFQVERVEANKSVVRTFCTRNAWSLSTKLRNTSLGEIYIARNHAKYSPAGVVIGFHSNAFLKVRSLVDRCRLC
jgi:hypothetical protein